MSYLMRVHYLVVRLFAGIAGFCVAFLIVGIGAVAIMRSSGIGLIPGIIDLAEYSLFNIAILAAPWLVSLNEHIRVDILVSQLRGRWKLRAESFSNLVVLAIALVILYFSTRVFWESLTRGELVYRELIFPEWWQLWQIPASMLLISIELAHRLFTQQTVSSHTAPAVVSPLSSSQGVQ